MKTLNIFAKPYKNTVSYIESLDLRRLTKIFLIIGVILAIIGSYFWYTRLYMTNERRFWSAIDNSLSTKSVTRTIVSGGTGNEVVQTQRFAYAPQMASESKVSFDQKSSIVNTSVVTEGILFPDAQYSRYIAFSTNQQGTDGAIPSLDNILGKWEGNEIAESDIEQAKLSYVSELVSLVIFGNYDPAFRSNLLQNLRNDNVYELNLKNVIEDKYEGQDVLVYSVSVGLRGYATQLQSAFVKSGYGSFPPLNPENYREDSRIPANIYVNKKSNSVVGVSFGSRQESYSGYGIVRQIERPQVEFGPGELENLVQQEIQGIL